MNKSEFSVGQVVTIYERPWTGRIEEGEATLVELLDVKDDGAERWVVTFLDGPLAPADCERTIVPEQYWEPYP